MADDVEVEVEVDVDGAVVVVVSLPPRARITGPSRSRFVAAVRWRHKHR